MILPQMSRLLPQVMRKCKDEMVQKVVMFFQCAFNVLNFEDVLNDHEDERTREFMLFISLHT